MPRRFPRRPLPPPLMALIALTPLLAACSAQMTDQEVFDAAAFSLGKAKPAGTPVHLVGAPYNANGRWYYPRHQPDYFAVGTASIYGARHTGRPTANGETFDADNLFAAHPTLPLPSYVEVRNLANNRSLTVRVNDRGPFNGRHIIALSARAAEVLGLAHIATPAASALGQAKHWPQVEVHYLAPAPIRHVGHPANINKNVGHPANINKNVGHPANINKNVGHPANINKNVGHPANINKNVGHPANISRSPGHKARIANKR